MINVKCLRELALKQPTATGRPLHLSAASGLVCVQQHAYVVADDEFHLGWFDLAHDTPGSVLKLFPGELPDDKAERKALKPDLETLTLLPAMPGHPHGALLALGSGSKKNRRTGVLLPLDAVGAIDGPPQHLALKNVYRALEDHVDDLNIEGAFVSGDQLLLLQRGNKKSKQNALVALPLEDVLLALHNPDTEIDIDKRHVICFDLGNIGGVPLGFTDGAALPNGDFVFSAVAENTDDSYQDGACLGAVIGIARQDGTVLFCEQLDHPWKVEGVSARLENSRIHLLLVTDADDPQVPATLLSAQIDRYPGMK